MKEDPTNIEPVTEAELARVAAERCRCSNPRCPTNVASDIARELVAARAAIKVAGEALERIATTEFLMGTGIPKIANAALAQLNP